MKMSLIDQLKSRRKQLRPCETVVTNIDGTVYSERSTTGGEKVKTSSVTRSLGFVVDLKPDLEIGWVLRNLGLSSQDVALDLRLLKDNQISHILSIGVDVPHVCENEISYKFIELYDLPETRLEDALPECLEFIESGMRLGRVLVHCNAGVSRSCSVAIAYLMSCGRTYQEAFDVVRSVRPVAKPNEGFVRQLKELEEKFAALDKKCFVQL